VDRGSTNFDQYKARGKRFILLEEPYEKKTDDSFLKNLSGAGGMVSTQEKGKNGVEWKPQGVLHITANHVPKIDTKDDAIVKRMNIVGFNVRGEKIADTEDKSNLEPADIHMRDCANEMFEWVLAGAKEYNETKTVILSEAIVKAARSNIAQGSAVIRWLMEQCEWTADDTVPPRWELHKTTTHTAMVKASKDEFLNFNLWCGMTGEKPVSKATWEDEINRFMGEPAERHGKRSGGSTRLWGVSEKDNKSALSAIAVQGQARISAMIAR
jgi:phage/plasmid-associated DNA primase